MYDFLTENDLLTRNQPGFRSGEFHQGTLDRVNGFDKGLEVPGIFLDISKAFEKVWHDGLILKQRQNGISRDIINILQDFLRNKKQRVI